MSSRTRAAVAGLVAVAVALAVGELAAGLVEGVPSLVTSVGSLLIPFVPPAVESFVISLVGTSDKAVLNTGTTLITLGLGAWAGVRARVRFSGAAVLFGVFGAFGLFAALLQPLVAFVPTVLAIAVAVGAGLGSLWVLLRVAARAASGDAGEPPDDGERDASRRTFLGMVVAGLGAAAVIAVTGRALVRSRTAVDPELYALPEPVRALPAVSPAQAFEDVAGLSPILVPNREFYRIDTALTVPRVDPDTWTLRIHGMVDREVEWTYSDLLAMPLVERDVTLSCVSNEIGGDLVGNARWLGVPLVDLLERAGVQDGATQIVGRAVDGWTAGFPTEVAFDGRESLLAVGMNGEPLPAAHGFPARLVVPGLYGYVSATKWISDIELTTWEEFDAYWVPRGWAKEGPIKTSSRIDVPRRNARVPAGPTVVAGVAWAPHRGIQRVEVQVDDGGWLEAELTEPLSDDAWRQWRVTADLDAGDHLLRVRATDGRGRVQVERLQPPRPDGATGWDVIRVIAEAA